MVKRLLFVLLYSTTSFAQWNDLEVIEAIAWVESRHNKFAVGSKDDVGYLQIRPIYVKEVNRITPYNFSLEDRFSMRKSILMVLLMWEYKHKGDSIECKIRKHNGGNLGCEKEITENYYKKVINYLESYCN